MIVSICGAQGQGKSTVLASLRDAGYNIIENKTSRNIITKMGISLEEIYSNKETARTFQDEIWKQHTKTCAMYEDDHLNLYFIERSFSDIFSYALAILGPYNEYSSWLNEYYEKCKESQKLFSGIFYLTGRDVIPENDGVRSTNYYFSKLVDSAIVDYLSQFSQNHYVYKVNYADHGLRINYINSVIETNYSEYGRGKYGNR